MVGSNAEPLAIKDTYPDYTILILCLTGCSQTHAVFEGK